MVMVSNNLLEGPAFQYEIGKRLALLWEEGAMILASGNVVHNLEW